MSSCQHGRWEQVEALQIVAFDGGPWRADGGCDDSAASSSVTTTVCTSFQEMLGLRIPASAIWNQ